MPCSQGESYGPKEYGHHGHRNQKAVRKITPIHVLLHMTNKGDDPGRNTGRAPAGAVIGSAERATLMPSGARDS